MDFQELQAAAVAKGWRPEVGDTIKGRLLAVQQGWSDQSNSFYPLLTIKTEGGEVVNVHCFHHVLRRLLLSQRPNMGDRVEITYHGKKPSKDGTRTIAVYTMETPDTPKDAQSVYDRLGADSPPPRSGGGVQAVSPTVEDDDDIPF